MAKFTTTDKKVTGGAAIATSLFALWMTILLRFFSAAWLMVTLSLTHNHTDAHIPAIGYWGCFWLLWLVGFTKSVLWGKQPEFSLTKE